MWVYAWFGFCMVAIEDPSLRFFATMHVKDQVLENIFWGTFSDSCIHIVRTSCSQLSVRSGIFCQLGEVFYWPCRLKFQYPTIKLAFWGTIVKVKLPAKFCSHHFERFFFQISNDAKYCRVDTAIWVHHRDANWTYGEKVSRQLHKNVASCIEQVLEATPHKQQLNCHLPSITKTVQVRLTSHAGHCWRSKNELISNVFLWTSLHGRAKVGGPIRTYIQQLNTGYSLEDLPGAMDDRKWWRERVREIRVSSLTWWWWWWWYTIFKSETKKNPALLVELLAVTWVPCILRHPIEQDRSYWDLQKRLVYIYIYI